MIDLHLPGLTGLDVHGALTERASDVPTVIVTGHDQPGTAERALAAGASAFLRKPLDDGACSTPSFRRCAKPRCPPAAAGRPTAAGVSLAPPHLRSNCPPAAGVSSSSVRAN